MNDFAKGRVIPLIDEDGYKLPKNMSKQFRDVQGGIEYLKNAADDITIELKGVNHKLSSNTANLSEVIKKVNSIEINLKNHMKQTQKAFKSSEKTTQAMLTLVLKISDMIMKANKTTS